MGWGRNVAEMLEAEVSLQQFVEAGTAVLDQRISNAPAERRETAGVRAGTTGCSLICHQPIEVIAHCGNSHYPFDPVAHKP